MNLIAIGYFAKWTVQRPDWLCTAGVEEICSVSTCISAGPEDWVSSWKHNALCLFDDEETPATMAAAAARPEAFDLYYYELLPVCFAADEERNIAAADLPALAGSPPNVTPRQPGYERLGYDCVQTEWKDTVAGFGCSPLSCNYMAREIAVNRYCLIGRLDDAIEAARLFARRQPEPGDYYIVEVWRKRRGDGNP